jgi:hypothetical protein
MKLTDLLDPLPAGDIEWRIQQSGKKGDKIWAKVLAYVTNRAIMARLDTVCGAENWKNEYVAGPDGGILCGLSIYIEGRGWVTKWDGAENTDVEAVKGGLSGAMKRAAVQWGIGRYLYDLDEGWANVHDRGRFSAKLKENNEWFKWDAPELPPWALPAPKVKTPANAAAALRLLVANADPVIKADVEISILNGMTRDEAATLHGDLKAKLTPTGNGAHA